jgi:hypothetical protein
VRGEEGERSPDALPFFSPHPFLREKFALQACTCADNGGEKRNVLIVSVLLPIAICLALRSKTQRRIEVLGMR